MIVRPATPEDARGIAEAHVRSWQVAYAHAFPADRLAGLSIDEREVRWRHNLADDAVVTTVAVDGGRVVGFAGVGASHAPDADGELYAIYVAPDAWGSGAATALMDDALERLRGASCRDAVLWVLEDNPRARRFYEKHGWRVDGASRVDTYLDTDVTVVRYRIPLVH